MQKLTKPVTLGSMAVTGAAPGPHAAEFAQVERLVQSSVLHSSESLCKLLRYLVLKALEQPGVALKEYQIATEVFGRSESFDPRLDSTVRVQTGRLRAKLAEYYSTEGAGDAIVIEVPKGAYQVTFVRRELVFGKVETPARSDHVPLPSTVEAAPAPSGRWRTAALVLGAVLAVALATLGFILLRPQTVFPARASASVPAPMRAFWSPYMQHPEDPLVVFSNAAFVGRPETGLRYMNPATDPPGRVLDYYTGVGEVLAIHELDRVFFDLQRALVVKRGQLLSLDDLKNSDVIFVGSPSENLVLREIPGTTEFVFRTLSEGPRKGDLAVFNTHPRPGEQPTYIAGSEPPIDEDYAVLALRPGLNSSRWEMILAGTTTIGTQAAVEFVTHEPSVVALEARIPHWQAGAPFEALLHVKVTRGVPVHSDLVALRTPAE